MTEKEELKVLAESLTPLQRRVVSNIVSGKYSNREAYYKAGGTAKTDETADASVSEILSNPKVNTYKEALLEEIDRENILTRTELLKLMSDIAKGENFTIDPESPQDEVSQLKTQLQASKLLAEMEGHNKPKKVKHIGKLEIAGDLLYKK